MGVLDSLSLPVQVGQGTGANILGLVGKGLAGLEALGAAVEAVGAGEQLLALLEVNVRGTRGVVLVAGAKEGRAVGGEVGQLATAGVDIGFVVAEALVDFAAGRGGNVGFFEAHLTKLDEKSDTKKRIMQHSVLTSSSASSSARSAWLMADFRSSPDSSGIWSIFCDRSAWTSLSSASYELKSSEPASVSRGFAMVAVVRGVRGDEREETEYGEAGCWLVQLGVPSVREDKQWREIGTDSSNTQRTEDSGAMRQAAMVCDGNVQASWVDEWNGMDGLASPLRRRFSGSRSWMVTAELQRHPLYRVLCSRLPSGCTTQCIPSHSKPSHIQLRCT